MCHRHARGEAKCTVSGTWRPCPTGRGQRRCPVQCQAHPSAQGAAGARSSWHQCRVQFAGRHSSGSAPARHEEGREQARCTGAEPGGGGFGGPGGQVLESAAVAGFGATLPEPQVNRSREKEQRKGWRASGPDRVYLAIPIRKTPGGSAPRRGDRRLPAAPCP